MPARRIEFTVPEKTWEQIEQARGDVPRAAWIKKAIDLRLTSETPDAVSVVRRRKPPTVSETWAR